MNSTAPRRRGPAAHRAEVETYIGIIDGLSERGWTEPWSPGKWSPAEITQHLVHFYEVALRDLEGKGGLRSRVNPPLRWVSRWLILPHILFHRTIPFRVRAPRELRPADTPLEREETRRALEQITERFESAVRQADPAGDQRIDHPYFGSLTPRRFLDFATVHLAHHRRQVESVPVLHPHDPSSPRVGGVGDR